MTQRAHAVFHVKSIDDDQRIIEGTATSPVPDRVGDVVEPLGATFRLPLPLLWQHRHEDPVGQVVQATASPSGILVRAQIAKILEPGALKDIVDKAWTAVKHELVRGLSIGFMSKNAEPLATGGVQV